MSEEKTCKNCGKQINEKFKLCPYCGANNEEELKKTNSNTNQSDNSIICQSCGKPKKSEFQICPYCQNKKEKEKIDNKGSRYKFAIIGTIIVVCLFIFTYIKAGIEDAINAFAYIFTFGLSSYNSPSYSLPSAINTSVIIISVLWIINSISVSKKELAFEENKLYEDDKSELPEISNRNEITWLLLSIVLGIFVGYAFYYVMTYIVDIYFIPIQLAIVIGCVSQYIFYRKQIMRYFKKTNNAELPDKNEIICLTLLIALGIFGVYRVYLYRKDIFNIFIELPDIYFYRLPYIGKALATGIVSIIGSLVGISQYIFHKKRIMGYFKYIKTNNAEISDKDGIISLILLIVFGRFGGHRFYAGKYISATLLLIVWLVPILARQIYIIMEWGSLFRLINLLIDLILAIDFIFLIIGKFKDSKGKYLESPTKRIMRYFKYGKNN